MTAKDGLRLLVLEGDGIGPEITAATLAVLRAADAKFALGLSLESASIGPLPGFCSPRQLGPSKVTMVRRTVLRGIKGLHELPVE